VTGFNPGVGFDNVTGWGSPTGSGLINLLTVPVLTVSAGPYTWSTPITLATTFPEFTGTVTFTATKSGTTTANTITTCAFSNGTCSASTTGGAIGVGTYNIVAVYEETSTSTKKYSSATPITIVADSTSTSASASPSSILTTATTVLSATVTDTTTAGNTPAGTVTFTEGATTVGSCTLSGGTCSSAAILGSTLGTGTDPIKATYSPATAEWTTSNGSTSVTVTAPATGNITFSSVSHNFGQVAVGTAASAYGISITNSSSTAYPFSLNFTAANGFTSATNCGTSIAAGKSCELVFSFTPTATGSVSATWSLAAENGFTYAPSNGGTLTGSGTTSGGVSLTTAGHNFGTVAVGTTSPTYGVVLSNSTTAAVTLSLGSVSSPYAVATNCGATLAAGASCNIQFTFTPTSTSTVQQVYALSASTPITSGGAALPNGGITLTGN
jgi:hypothetical protein